MCFLKQKNDLFFLGNLFKMHQIFGVLREKISSVSSFIAIMLMMSLEIHVTNVAT